MPRWKRLITQGVVVVVIGLVAAGLGAEDRFAWTIVIVGAVVATVGLLGGAIRDDDDPGK